MPPDTTDYTPDELASLEDFVNRNSGGSGPKPNTDYTPDELSFLEDFVNLNSGGSGQKPEPDASREPASERQSDRGAHGPDVNPAPGTKPKVPKLPAGAVLDLTRPEITAPNIEPFTTPSEWRVIGSPDKMVQPLELTQEDWIVLVKRAEVLRAYTLEDIHGDDGAPRAKSWALNFKVPETADFYEDMTTTSSVISQLTYSEGTDSYVRAGFDKQSASLSIPFAAASVEREHKERQARATESKQLHMVGRWYYPRVKLHLRKCAVASDRFLTAVKEAVEARDPKKLDNVFKEFGCALPEEVVVGGQLLLTHKKDFKGEIQESEVETTIKAAVSAKYKNVEADAGVGFGSAESGKVTANQLRQETSFTAIGGDTLLSTDPPRWTNTVKQPRMWAVIGISKLVPITEWLPQDLRAKVELLMPAIGVAEDQKGFQQSDRANTDQFIFAVSSDWLPSSSPSFGGNFRLVCGSSMSPDLDQGDAAGAAVSVRFDKDRDLWIAGASLFLPVLKSKSYTFKRDNYEGVPSAPTQLARASSGLALGQWRLLTEFNQGTEGETAFPVDTTASDGFVLCSLTAVDGGDRGWAEATVDGKTLGAASVWRPLPREDMINPSGGFCIPAPRNSKVQLLVKATRPSLRGKIWYLPSTSEHLRFGSPESFVLESAITADTDGFLNASLIARAGAYARGMLTLYTGRKKAASTGQGAVEGGLRLAAHAAVHQTVNRQVPSASAMLPVRRGYHFYAGKRDFSGDIAHLDAKVWWTPLVLVT